VGLHPGGGSRSLMLGAPNCATGQPLGLGGLWDRVVGVPGALLAQRSHIFISHLLKHLELSEYA
jgi:hypothetical protein